MEKIDKAIDNFFKNLPAQKVKELKAFEVFQECIPQKLKKGVELKDINDGIIFLKVASPILRSEIEFIKNRILDEINYRIGEKFVKDIKFERMQR